MDEAEIDEYLAANGDAVVCIRGEHDLSTAPELRERIDRAGERAERTVIDLDQCTFMDSSVLGVLVGALRRAHERARALELVLSPAASPAIHRTFDLTGLRDAFTVRTTREGL